MKGRHLQECEALVAYTLTHSLGIHVTHHCCQAQLHRKADGEEVKVCVCVEKETGEEDLIIDKRLI